MNNGFNKLTLCFNTHKK